MRASRSPPTPSSETGTAKGKIEGNSISLYQKGGITANGAGTDVNIKDNRVNGLGPVPFIAQNGIQIGFGANGSVKETSPRVAVF